MFLQKLQLLFRGFWPNLALFPSWEGLRNEHECTIMPHTLVWKSTLHRYDKASAAVQQAVFEVADILMLFSC